MKKILTILGISLSLNAFGQNEFYNNGAVIYINGQAGTNGAVSSSDAPTLYVKGDLVNKSGSSFTNNGGEVQLTGNLTVESGSTYTTTGDEVFTGSANQTVTGDFNTNLLYNVILDKSSGTSVDLANDLNVQNTLVFNSAGRIRTDITGYANHGESYAHEVYIQSSSTGALSGHSMSNGATDNYVEGKLRRQVNGSGTYDFPIGADPASTTIDKTEPFSLNFTSATNSNILGVINGSPTYDLLNLNVFCDVAAYTGTTGDINNGDINTTDGRADRIIIDGQYPIEWTITASGGTYNYDVTFYPSNTLKASNNFFSSPALGKLIRFIAKNGQPLDVTQSNPYPNWGPGYVTCPSAAEETLTGLTSFSSFRFGGLLNSSNTALPIELLYFTGRKQDENAILDWATASEVNCSYFAVEKSRDGINFREIGQVQGHGTTQVQHTYNYIDQTPYNGVNYYRLRQVDIDGVIHYTNIISLNFEKDFAATAYPNPFSDEVILDVYSGQEGDAVIDITNAIGQRILSQPVTVANSTNLYHIASTDWLPGAYFIKITSGDKSAVLKVVRRQ